MFRAAWFTFALAFVLAIAQAGSASASAPSTNTNASMTTHWIHYMDVAEGAFSMDVPAGWQVQGGMWRFEYFDARWMMTVRTLDGAMVIRLDDVSLPPYVLPSPSTGPAGQPYTKPQQFQMMVADYQNADDYARLYANHRFKSVCKSLTARSGTPWRPTMPPGFALGPNVQKISQASLSLVCATSEGQRIVTVYARTTQFPVVYGSGFWVADPLISILTTKQDEHASYAVAQHMLASWRKNPKWVAYQNQLTKLGLEQIQANHQDFSGQTQTQMQAFRSSMSAQVNGFESRSRVPVVLSQSMGKSTVAAGLYCMLLTVTSILASRGRGRQENRRSKHRFCVFRRHDYIGQQDRWRGAVGHVDEPTRVFFRAKNGIDIGDKIDGGVSVNLCTASGQIHVRDKIDNSNTHVWYWPQGALVADSGIQGGQVNPDQKRVCQGLGLANFPTYPL